MQMRKKTLLIIGLLCLALTLCACSNEKKQYLGTWKLKDGNVLITDSETTMQATLEKQQLKLIDNDTVLIFEKQ